MFRSLLLTALASFLAMPLSVSAQETVAPAEPPAFLKDVRSQADFSRLTPEQKQEAAAFMMFSPAGPPTDDQPVAPGTANCFDYYAFGSVQVDATPTIGQTVPGMPITFTGKIKNANTYPVVGGQVYAKIFKLEEKNSELTHQNGYPLVSFFLAQDNIAIPANGEKPLTFEWQVPANMAGGEYAIAFFFTTEYRFNLLGLSFTDDITGNKATFRVTDDVNAPAAFNKHAVYLNDTLFRFAAPPTRFNRDEKVMAHVEVANPSNTEKVVEVAWVTSHWDGILAKHEVKRETESVLLKAKQTRTLSYAPPVLDTTVTFLRVVLTDQDAESILHIRFVREGNIDLRINYPSVTEYPLQKGKETTIFSCLHSTNLPLISNNTLTLTIKDENHEVVHSYEYKGDVTSAMMGVKDTFTPPRDLVTFSLTATLSHEDTLIDEVTIYYDCATLGAHCPGQTTDGISATDAAGSVSAKTLAIFMGVFILVVSVAIVYRRKRKLPEIY